MIRRYDGWPRSCASGCPQIARNLYLLPGGGLGFEPPAADTSGPLAFDDAASRPDVVVYESETLTTTPRNRPRRR